jgi:23S rRNA (uridine2552-2'-O)-methyltransferase
MRKRRKDYFYRLAKLHKYRSRAAYKLKYINTKFNVIKIGDVVIDLGAAPGGWSQVAKEFVGKDGFVIGLDLKRIEPIEGVLFLKCDLKNPYAAAELVKSKICDYEFYSHKPDRFADVIISDMSPKISGTYSIDHALSIELAECALNFSKLVLKKGGNFVVKVFQGDMYDTFFKTVKNQFQFCKAYKSKASRSESAEIYIVALGYRF